MKRYALLRLQDGANQVIGDCGPCDFKTAVATFQKGCVNITLDDKGYAKLGDRISFCVAEYHESFCTMS